MCGRGPQLTCCRVVGVGGGTVAARVREWVLGWVNKDAVYDVVARSCTVDNTNSVSNSNINRDMITEVQQCQYKDTCIIATQPRPLRERKIAHAKPFAGATGENERSRNTASTA